MLNLKVMRIPFMFALLVLLVVVLGVLLPGPNSGVRQLTTGASTVIVTDPIDSGSNHSLNFSPSVIVIVIGINNTVNWVNEDTVPHTAHSDVYEFDTGIMWPGAKYTHTFTRPGVYTYHCDYHPWMIGKVIVKGQ